jgi:hypothetical protein
MPYIGTQPLTGQFKKLDAITVVNGQAAYTLNYNSAAYKPATANALLVSVNGVIQAAGDAYTINGSTITFTENLVTGDVIDFIIALGDTGSAVTPVDGSVTTAKIATDAVTTAKIADDAVTRAKMADDLSGTNLAIDTTSSTFKMTDLTSNAFYRIGTWTPIVSSSNATDTSLSCINQTNTTEQGNYVRIGDIVHCNFYLILPSVSFGFTNGASGTDSAKIRGLPFNIENLTNYYPVASCGYFANWTGWTASYTPMGYLSAADQSLNLTHAVATGTSAIQLASVGYQNAAMIYSFTYKTDDA